MASLKEELQKQIKEELANSAISSAMKEKILANLDTKSVEYLMEMADILLLRNSPEVLQKKKIHSEEKLSALKERADEEILTIQKCQNT